MEFVADLIKYVFVFICSWKDMKNPFRLDSNIKLMVIPTLIRWKSVLRLEGDQCTKMDLLDMFFNEE